MTDAVEEQDRYVKGDRVYLKNRAGTVMFDNHGKSIVFAIDQIFEWEDGSYNCSVRSYDRDAHRMYSGSIGFPSWCFKRAE